MAPTTKPKKIRAFRGWSAGPCLCKGAGGLCTIEIFNCEGGGEHKFAALDVSDADALVEQVAQSIQQRIEKRSWARLYKRVKDFYREVARAVLEDMNLISKRRAKR